MPVTTGDVFEKFSSENKLISVSELVAKLNSEVYPEVVEGIQLYSPGYTSDSPDNFSLESFTLMLKDFYGSDPRNYLNVLKAVF